jgi:uncharacterized protein YkwD
MRYKLGFLILLILSIRLQGQLYGQDDISGFEYYKQLNDSEKRLMEFKDDDTALRNKINQLLIINQSRKKFRVPVVKLDILASRVANKHCREAAEKAYISHWNMNGEKPYMRYAFAGGYDHVSENAYGEWTSEDFSTSKNIVSELMKSGHATFMKEKAPNDGHKKNIISKDHNYAGIGYYVAGGQFRYYEEFIDRYLEFRDIPAEMSINETGYITVDTRENGFLYFMTIYREKLPKPLSIKQLSGTGSYEDYSSDVFVNMPAWDLSRYRKGSTYKIPLKFTKDGLYYIHLFIDKKENTGSTSVSTKGKEPVSGIVIKVTR